MTQQNTKPNSSPEDDEIDLITLAKTLWEGRKTIIKTTLICLAIGLFIGIFSKTEYTASSITLPQTDNSSSVGGGLSGLAAMAGINLGDMMGGSGIPPSLYPQIVNSLSFQKKILQTPLTIKGYKNKKSFQDYYLNIYNPGLFGYLKEFTIGLPGLIRKEIKKYFKSENSDINEGFLSISEDENELIKKLTKQVTIDYDKQNEYITVTAKMPEALMSAEMAESALQLLQQYIIDFKIQKSAEQLKFLKERYNVAENNFRQAQKKVANFRDNNQNVNTSIAKSKLDNLQTEYDLAFSVYSGLAKQVEAFQLEVKKDTPVFTVIDSVSIPYEKSFPKRFLILFISGFLGVILGAGLILIKNYIKTVREKFNLY